MKKAAVVALIVALCTVLFACYKAPDLEGVEIKTLTMTKVYEKEGKWEHAQGLGTDGRFFYYAGHNDDKKVESDRYADIHVIDMETMKETDVFLRQGALHSAEVCYRKETGTLTTCSGGDGRRPYVFELDCKTGEKIDEWDFAELGQKGGGLHVFDEKGRLIMFTSSEDGAKISFDIVTLGTGGAYTVEESYYFGDTDLGVPQGLEYYDGYVYLLDDAGRTVSKNPHYIYKIKLENNKVNIVTAYSIDYDHETEGMCIAPDGKVYMGDADENIFVFDLPITQW